MGERTMMRRMKRFLLRYNIDRPHTTTTTSSIFHFLSLFSSLCAHEIGELRNRFNMKLFCPDKFDLGLLNSVEGGENFRIQEILEFRFPKLKIRKKIKSLDYGFY